VSWAQLQPKLQTRTNLQLPCTTCCNNFLHLRGGTHATFVDDVGNILFGVCYFEKRIYAGTDSLRFML